MPELRITPNLEQAPWNDLQGKMVPEMGTITRIGRLPRGMTSGLSSVTVVITLADGSNVMGETSLACMSAAMRAIDARAAMEGETR